MMLAASPAVLDSGLCVDTGCVPGQELLIAPNAPVNRCIPRYAAVVSVCRKQY